MSVMCLNDDTAVIEVSPLTVYATNTPAVIGTSFLVAIVSLLSFVIFALLMVFSPGSVITPDHGHLLYDG
eukprot:Awhi_evm1s2064